MRTWTRAAAVVAALLVAGCSTPRARPAAGASGSSVTTSGSGADSVGSAATGSGSAATSTPVHGTLVVRVTLTGGPANQDGKMSLDNTPSGGQAVVVIGPSGHRWHGQTAKDGERSFDLAPGTYRLSGDCSGRARPAEVTAGAITRVTLRCYVP